MAKNKPNLPSREQLQEFLKAEPKAGLREAARAFRVRASDKPALREMLRELRPKEDRGPRPAKPPRGKRLPATLIVEVFDIDADEGEALARPVDEEYGRPILRLAGSSALTVGDRALVGIEGHRGARFRARVIKRVERAPTRILGVFRPDEYGGRIQPTDRKIRTEFMVPRADAAGAQDGEIVLAEATSERRLGLPSARIVERLGRADSPRAASLIAIHAREIPTEFPAAALEQAAQAAPAPVDGREDLRAVPLVTIDGEDARDFDDAVFAEPDKDPANPGGHRLIVAIADVGWYVRPGDALDRASRERGNSVYFPDRVVPMLPERLSNDLCSLRPHEDRPTMAVEIWIDKDGQKKRHRFMRAVMCSAARLTYEQAQNAVDGLPNGAPVELQNTVIEPLYAAYRALFRARQARGVLDLDLEERKVTIDAQGRIERIVPRARLDSHRLIEEFMVLANVCAAESLEERRLPCMYRVHDTPEQDRVDSLREVLDGLGYRLARGQVLRPRHFNQILQWAKDTPYRHMINDLVLRSQAMAVYSPDNKGHFGLALARYAHFTSPIRRYSDLLVHRALITAYGFGAGGLFEKGPVDMHDVAEHISNTERRAAAAERDALNRYVVAWLKDRVGAQFGARVSGVAQFGLFVTLDGLGADGLIPMRSLTGDFYQFDATRHRLVGQRTGTVFTLGDPVEVKLVEAQPTTGGLTFELLSGGSTQSREGKGPRLRERDRDRAARGHQERMQRGKRRR